MKGSEIVVAAAGLRDPTVIVSTGALLRLDDAELNAGLQHEWGHVVRNHRVLSLVAEVCAGAARPLPGTKRALRNLKFHLERDADDYAVRRTGDRLALASAICKAAQAKPVHPSSALVSLAGSGISERLRLLACESRPNPSRLMTLGARTLAASLLVSTLGLLAATPTFGAGGVSENRVSME
ncbi:MAG: M56 family metallopeptidase, partial [Actinomycetota bacterium]|nr:M56 family metallopeptidase [Actinomycetota bacterium]